MDTDKNDKKVILCDFDGTIADVDVCDVVMKKFSPDEFTYYGNLFDKGEISHDKMNEIFLNNLNVSPKKLSVFLKKNIRIREGFYEFVEYCIENNIVLIIVSTGWDFYIKKILGKVAIYFPGTPESVKMDIGKLPVICNKINYINEKKSWDIFYQWKSEGDFSPDKREIVLCLQKSFDKVFIIGDGSGDYGMALLAHRIFSINELTSFCKNKKLPYYEFGNFFDIMKNL